MNNFRYQLVGVSMAPHVYMKYIEAMNGYFELCYDPFS